MKKAFLSFLFVWCGAAIVMADVPGWIISDAPVQQTEINGVPVDRYGPTWVLRGAPDLVADEPLQAGNNSPRIKIIPQTSDRIKENYIGLDTSRMPRSRQADVQPLEPVHLIDGDVQSCWLSKNQRRPDHAPVWIQLDLPVAKKVSRVALVKRPILKPRNPYSYPVIAGGQEVGRGFPESILIETSLDNHEWTTVYDGPIDTTQERVEIAFDEIKVKQIRLTAGRLPRCEIAYAFSMAELEVLDSSGKNVAAISNGVGITASSTEHGLGQEIETHRWLWPIQSGIGAKWIRIGYHDDPVNWHHVEKEKGILALDPVADAAITEMADHGLNIVLCLDFGNRLYSGPEERSFPQMWEWYWDLPAPPTTPEALSAWDRYVEYIVNKTKDRVHYYELWNEWDISLYWGETPSVEQYIALAKRTAEIVRHLAPDAKIVSGSVSGGGFPWGCSVWNQEQWNRYPETNIYGHMFKELVPLVDVFAWHPYYNPDPNLLNNYPEDVIALKKWFVSLGFQGKCMATEWNTSCHDTELLEEDKDVFWTGRIHMNEMMKAKITAQIFIQDTGLDLASFFCEIYNPYHPADLSLLRRSIDTDPVSSLQPQAAFYVVRNLATILDEFKPEELEIGVEGIEPEKVRIFTFKTPKGHAVALWTKGWPTDNESNQNIADLTVPCSLKDEISVSAVDPVNGVSQKLVTESKDSQISIPGLKIGDAPVLVLLEN